MKSNLPTTPPRLPGWFQRFCTTESQYPAMPVAHAARVPVQPNKTDDVVGLVPQPAIDLPHEFGNRSTSARRGVRHRRIQNWRSKVVIANNSPLPPILSLRNLTISATKLGTFPSAARLETAPYPQLLSPEYRGEGSKTAPSRRLNAISLLVVIITTAAMLAPFDAAKAQDPSRTRSLLAEDQLDSVLLLHSGRIVSGKVKLVSTGYLISSQSGNVVITRDEVRHVANNMNELYLLQKRDLKDPTVNEQLKLAEWCVVHRLNAFAAKELLLVLERDPGNETARRLLARLDELEARTTTPAKAAPPNEPARGPKLADSEARSLVSLAPTTAERFTSAIQPLLHNKCGNARCHGTSSDHEFRLTRGVPGAGNHRMHVERNLASILRYVDTDRPHESRLLTIMQGAHGGQTLFAGRSGADQQKLLTDWMLTAVRDINPQAKIRPIAKVTTGKPEPAGIRTESPEAALRSSETSVGDSESLLTEPEKSTFRKVVEDSSDDAFDPEKFNRMR